MYLPSPRSWTLQIELAAAIQIQLHLRHLHPATLRKWLETTVKTTCSNPECKCDNRDHQNFERCKPRFGTATWRQEKKRVHDQDMCSSALELALSSTSLPNVKQQRQKHIPGQGGSKPQRGLKHVSALELQSLQISSSDPHEGQQWNMFLIWSSQNVYHL